MNSRERMDVAMHLGVPDRVPVMCQLLLGHYFLQSGIDPIEIWYSGEAFGEALIALQRRYGFDGILINLPGRDPGWRTHVSRRCVAASRCAAIRAISSPRAWELSMFVTVY
jgi:hypothetical protein